MSAQQTQKNTAEKPENLINSLESNESEKQLAIVDLRNFKIIDGLNDAEKTALKKTVSQKAKVNENHSHPLADKIPEISGVADFSEALAKNKKDELNAIAIGSVVALTELLENFSSVERQNFLVTAKTNPAGIEGWENLTEAETKSLAVVSTIITQEKFLKNSAGKVIKDNWAGLVDLVGAGMKIADEHPEEMQNAEESIREINTSRGLGTTAASVGGGLAGSFALARKIPHPVAKVVGSVGGYFLGSSASTAGHNAITGENNKSFFETMGELSRGGIDAIKGAGVDTLKGFGLSKEKARSLGGVASLTVAATIGYFLIQGLFSSNEDEKNGKGGGFWKGLALTAGLALGIPALMKYGGDALKNLMPEGLQNAIEDGKNAVVNGAKDLVDEGKEKISEADKKITDFWEGPENSEGERGGGKREEWAKNLEEKGYKQVADYLRNVTTGALEITGALGAGMGLVIFRKIFFGGAMKIMGNKWGILAVLGAGWFLSDSIDGMTKKEILEKFDILKSVEEKKKEVLKIYSDYGFDAPEISQLTDLFSSEKTEKYMSTLLDTSGDNFLMKHATKIGTGGLAIVGSLVGINAMAGIAKLMFSKLGISAGILMFGYSMGWDSTRFGNFKDATIKAFGKPLQKELAKINIPALQNKIPEISLLKDVMRRLGVSIYDYPISRKKASKIKNNLQELQGKHNENLEISEQITDLSEEISTQLSIDNAENIYLSTEGFARLFYRLEENNVDCVAEYVEGEGWSVMVDGVVFSGFERNPLLLRYPKTSEEQEFARKNFILSGLSQLEFDAVKVHGVKKFSKKYEFTKDDVIAVQKQIQEMFKKVEKSGSKGFIQKDIDELSALLKKMKATLSKNNAGEISVLFSSDDFHESATFVGISPEISDEEFVKNERVFDRNVLQISGEGYSEYYNNTTRTVLESLKLLGLSGKHLNKSLENLNVEESMGNPLLWGEIFLDIYNEYSDGEQGVGMALFDTGIAITILGTTVAIELGSDILNVIKKSAYLELDIKQDVVGSSIGSVIAVGTAAGIMEKITGGTHKSGTRKIFNGHYLFKSVRWSAFAPVQQTYKAGKHLITNPVGSVNKLLRGGNRVLRFVPYLAGKAKNTVGRVANGFSYVNFMRDSDGMRMIRKGEMIQRDLKFWIDKNNISRFGAKDKVYALRQEFSTLGEKFDKTDLAEKNNRSLSEEIKERGKVKVKEVKTSASKNPKKNPEYHKIIEKESKSIAQKLGLSAKREANLLKHGKTLMKTGGVIFALYAMNEIAEAQNPYSAITKEGAIMGVMTMGAKIGARGGIVGAVSGVVISGIAVAIWGEDAGEFIDKGFEKFEKKVIDENDLAKGYIDGGNLLSGITLSSYVSRLWDNTGGEIWKGEDAEKYFSDVDRKAKFSGQETFMNRGKDDIKDWNSDLEEKISEEEYQMKRSKLYWNTVSPERKDEIISQYGKNPSAQNISDELQKINKDDSLFVEKTYFLKGFSSQYKKEALLTQKIEKNGEWIQKQTQKFYVLFSSLPEKNTNTVEYYRNIFDFVREWKMLNNMELLENSFEIMRENSGFKKDTPIKIQNLVDTLKENKTQKNFPDEIKDLLNY